MASKRKSNPLSLVMLLTLLVLGAWGYQAANQQGRGLVSSAANPTNSGVSASKDLRIASWNIRQFGSRASTDLRAVARIIRENEFDVLAIQEVQRDGAGVDRLLNELGPPWRGTRLGDESRSGERLTFIYRGDRVTEVGRSGHLAGATPGVFDRVPYCATFRAGSFDCELITAHLSWGDVPQRQEEMKVLATLLADRAGSQSEKDLIVLGDFNEQKSRPNLSHMTRAGWQSVVTQGTNLSAREIYDHLLLNGTNTREYLGRTGVVCFDETLFAGNDREAAEAVSDHRPIWADFATNLPDDD